MINSPTIGSSSKFFLLSIVVGIILLLLGITVYSYSPDPSIYSYDSNYKGFFFITNDSSVLKPEQMVLEINVVDNPPTLFFHYDFEVTSNGTFNFIFIFPFEIIQQSTDLYNLNYTDTPFGSAIWVTDVIENPEISRSIIGKFDISNTFQFGEKGDYVFSLPLIWNFYKNDIVDGLKDKLELNYNVPQSSMELNFFFSQKYDKIEQISPQPYFFDPVHLGGSNQTMNKLTWKFDSCNESHQQFLVFCKNINLVKLTQYFILISGILISIGTGLLVTTFYEKTKEIDLNNQISKLNYNNKNEGNDSMVRYRYRKPVHRKIVKRNLIQLSEIINLRADYRKDIRKLDDQNFTIIATVSTITFAIMAAASTLLSNILFLFFFIIAVVNAMAIRMLLKNRISVLEKTWMVYHLESKLPLSVRRISPFNTSIFKNKLPKGSAYSYMITVHNVLFIFGFVWAVVSQLNVEGSLKIFSSAVNAISQLTNSNINSSFVEWLDFAIPYVSVLVIFGIFWWIINKKLMNDFNNNWEKCVWVTKPELLTELEKKFNTANISK